MLSGGNFQDMQREGREMNTIVGAMSETFIGQFSLMGSSLQVIYSVIFQSEHVGR